MGAATGEAKGRQREGQVGQVVELGGIRSYWITLGKRRMGVG